MAPLTAAATMPGDYFALHVIRQQQERREREEELLRLTSVAVLARLNGSPVFGLRLAASRFQWRDVNWVAIVEKGSWYGPGVASGVGPAISFDVILPGARKPERWVQFGSCYWHSGYWLPGRKAVNPKRVRIRDDGWTGTIWEWCAMRDAWNVLGDDGREHRGIGR